VGKFFSSGLVGVVVGTLSLYAPGASAASEPCLAYGLTRGEAQALDFTSPQFSFRSLPDAIWASYRQKAPLQRDPAGDFSLAAWAKESVARKAGSKLGGRAGVQREQRYQAEVSRAAPCAELIFGASVWIRPRYSITQWIPNQRDSELVASLEVSEVVRKQLALELQTGELSFHTDAQPIRVPEFSAMLEQVIREEVAQGGPLPTVGEVHKWDSRTFRQQDGRFFPVLRFSKLLVALARGETGRYMKAGIEDDLQAFLVSQPEQSVTHPELFRQAYRLAGGDVYTSVLGIESLLSRHWRDPQREQIDFVRALEPYVNSFGRNADNFGTWYHFYGVLLLGYAEGGAWTRKIGEIEALGSHVLSPNVDKTQKRWVNRLGGDVGSRLMRSVKSGTWSSVASDPSLLKRESYLNRDSEIRGRVMIRALEIEAELGP
jgi:hypothetical protein